MKRILLIGICFLSVFALKAQNGYKIDVTIENAKAPEIYLAYHFGSKQYISDTAKMVSPGRYIFQGEEALKGGIYLVAMPPTNRYFELLVTKEQQNFSVATDTTAYGLGMDIKGSKENKLFYEYISHLAKQREQAQAIQLKMQGAEVGEEEMLAFEKELLGLNEQVKQYQKNLISDHKGMLVSSLINANQEIEIPEAPEGAIENYRLYYYRNHYFDYIDWSDERMLRTPILEKKIMDYLDRLVVKSPDSISAGVDRILDLAYQGGNEEVRKFVVSRLLNEYATSKVMGMDGVYVHIAQKYYADHAKTPWMDEEQRNKIVENANRLLPILIGKKAPNLSLPQLTGSRISLYDLKTKYTILYFWDPDCGNCTKTTTKLVEMYDTYKAHGVEIFGVCNKAGDELGKCGEKVAKSGMKWINTADPDGRGQAHAKYYVTANPLIFVLDENKIIRYKRIDPEQLKMILDRELGLEEGNGEEIEMKGDE